MKRRDLDEIIQEIYNTGFGDALLFRISKQPKHPVREVKGDIPKTAFAGWFREVEDFLSNLRKRSNRPTRDLANEQPDREVPVAHRHQ